MYDCIRFDYKLCTLICWGKFFLFLQSYRYYYFRRSKVNRVSFLATKSTSKIAPTDGWARSNVVNVGWYARTCTSRYDILPDRWRHGTRIRFGGPPMSPMSSVITHTQSRLSNFVHTSQSSTITKKLLWGCSWNKVNKTLQYCRILRSTHPLVAYFKLVRSVIKVKHTVNVVKPSPLRPNWVFNLIALIWSSSFQFANGLDWKL